MALTSSGDHFVYGEEGGAVADRVPLDAEVASENMRKCVGPK